MSPSKVTVFRTGASAVPASSFVLVETCWPLKTIGVAVAGRVMVPGRASSSRLAG